MNEDQYIRTLDEQIMQLEVFAHDVEAFRRKLQKTVPSAVRNNVLGNVNICYRRLNTLIDGYRKTRSQVWMEAYAPKPDISDIMESELEAAIAKQGSPW